jgi:KDO2-lipid IV(A) lauroyltransferase
MIKNDFLVIYQPLKNKRTNQLFVNVRGKFGAELVPMKDFYKVLVENYKKNIPSSVYFLGDQRPAGAKKIHYWRKFLNQDTSFYMGPEKVSRKYNHAVVFMDIQKQKRGKYITSFELLFENGAETKEHEITDAFVDKLESVIKEKPQYWLWSHKRWKGSVNYKSK